MRISTVFISSALVLAGMSAALPVERENMLVARFADSDSLAEVEARAYDEEPKRYARGSVVSKESKEHNRDSRPASRRTASSLASSYRTASSWTSNHRTALSGGPPAPPPSRTNTDSNRPPSQFTSAQESNQMTTDFSGPPITHFRSSPNRRSFYETPRDELTRRGFRTWMKNGYSKVTGFFGGSSMPGTAQQMGDSQ